MAAAEAIRPPTRNLRRLVFILNSGFMNQSSFGRRTGQHSLAGADDQRSNHEDGLGPGPVQCLVIRLDVRPECSYLPWLRDGAAVHPEAIETRVLRFQP